MPQWADSSDYTVMSYTDARPYLLEFFPTEHSVSMRYVPHYRDDYGS